MQSLYYVLLAYSIGFFVLTAYFIKMVWERIQLRSLIRSLEEHHDSKK